MLGSCRQEGTVRQRRPQSEAASVLGLKRDVQPWNSKEAAQHIYTVSMTVCTGHSVRTAGAMSRDASLETQQCHRMIERQSRAMPGSSYEQPQHRRMASAGARQSARRNHSNASKGASSSSMLSGAPGPRQPDETGLQQLPQASSLTLIILSIICSWGLSSASVTPPLPLPLVLAPLPPAAVLLASCTSIQMGARPLHCCTCDQVLLAAIHASTVRQHSVPHRHTTSPHTHSCRQCSAAAEPRQDSSLHRQHSPPDKPRCI